MEEKAREQIVALVPEVPELRDLWTEHVDLEKKLAEYNRKHHLSAEEEVERKRIQKLKLAGKDRMMQILADRGEEAQADGPN